MSPAYGVPVSAPTLWEEGRLTASRVIRLAVIAGTLTLALDIAVNGHLTPLLDVAFVLICIGAVLGVRPTEFVSIALMPPLLLLVMVGVVAAVDTGYVAIAGDGWVQAVVTGITRHATGLAIGYTLVLAGIVVRLRVRTSRAGQRRAAQVQRSASPAPTRTTSG